jgi:hypothetical protein
VGAPDVHFEGEQPGSSVKSIDISLALRHFDTSIQSVLLHYEIFDSMANKCFTYTSPPFWYSSSSVASCSFFDSGFM